MKISYCIPIYNEALIIPRLFERLQEVVHNLRDYKHEVVLVNDGSHDETVVVLGEITKQEWSFDLKLLHLSRNFGQQQALSAALSNSTGDCCFIMDGDLQDDPSILPTFLSCFKDGYDVVYAKRVLRKEAIWLRACYYLFYRFLRKIAEYPMPLDAGDCSLLSRRVVDVINNFPECNRYLRGIRAWAGFKQIGISVERNERASGKPKYNFLKLLKLAADGIFSFSLLPIRLAIVFGSVVVGLCGLFACYSMYALIFLDTSPRGFTALLWTIMLIGGIQALFLGIIGEYVGRIYHEARQRPHYLIEKQSFLPAK